MCLQGRDSVFQNEKKKTKPKTFQLRNHEVEQRPFQLFEQQKRNM